VADITGEQLQSRQEYIQNKALDRDTIGLPHPVFHHKDLPCSISPVGSLAFVHGL